MLSNSLRLVLLGLCLQTLVIVNAQNAADEVQVDPNAVCDQTTRDRITLCLDQVEKDESKLPGGPCTSSDWSCICTKQQGLVDCYSPCPGLAVVDMIRFNQNSCKGQNGVTIRSEGGDLTYTWSSLNFTSTNTSSPDISSITASLPVSTSTALPTTTSATTRVSSTTTSRATNTAMATARPDSNGAVAHHGSAAVLAIICLTSIYALLM